MTKGATRKAGTTMGTPRTGATTTVATTTVATTTVATRKAATRMGTPRMVAMMKATTTRGTPTMAVMTKAATTGRPRMGTMMKLARRLALMMFARNLSNCPKWGHMSAQAVLGLTPFDLKLTPATAPFAPIKGKTPKGKTPNLPLNFPANPTRQCPP